MNKKKSLSICAVFLLFALFIPSILAVDVTPTNPLVLSNDDYTETLAGTGSATVESGRIQSFTLTGTYTKEFDTKYTIGSYSLKGKSKRQDMKIETENATVTKEKEEYSITGSSTIYKKNYDKQEELLLGSEDPSKEITYTITIDGTTIIITNTTTASKSLVAYMDVSKSGSMMITTNTYFALEKDNVGTYEKVYEQETGKTILQDETIHTDSTNNKIHFTTITINDDKTITWNEKKTPLTSATKQTLTAMKTKNGVTITNGKKTITYYTNKKEYDLIVNEANKKGKYYMC